MVATAQASGPAGAGGGGGGAMVPFLAASNIYAVTTVGHSQDFVGGNGGAALIANLGNPDRAIGHFVFWAADGRVWTGDYVLDSQSAYCATSGLVRQGT